MTALAEHAEIIARALLGEPNRELSTKAQLRFGTHGSLAVEIRGKKAGTWYCHETEAGGGLLDLIARERGGTRRDALQWIKSIGIEITATNGAAGPTRQRIAEYIYHDRDGEPVFRVVRWHPKTFTQERFDPAAGKFVGGRGCMEGVQRVPYRLHEWIDEPGRILITEGEKDADRLAELGELATTNAGGAGKWSKDFAPYFAGREVIICGDNDPAGKKHVRQGAANLRPVAKSLRIVWVPPLVGKDVSDWLDAGHTLEELVSLAVSTEEDKPAEEEDGAARIERLVKEATTDPGAPFEAEAVDFLAALRERDKAAYERARARLKTVRVRVAELDHLVESRKPEASADSAGKGKALDLPELEPWGEPVEGAELLAGLVEQIRRFVVLSDHAALAAALWVIHTHAHDAAFISPRLVALSPTKRCGKSSLFRVLARIARRPLPTSNISPSAMFRVIEAASPTLFCDEMSSIGDKERLVEIRGVVDSSHCRADARVIRNVPVPDGYEPRAFSTWAPMALAYIKHVDDQIRDRAVIIPMQRKAPDQAVAQMRLDQDQGFGVLARKAARWAADHFEALRRADPDVPRELNDRAADNWRCLLAIADAAGGPWRDRARAAAVALSTDADDDDVIGVELLRDLRVVFDSLKADRLLSSTIVAHLVGMEGRPWAEFGKTGKTNHDAPARPPAEAVQDRAGLSTSGRAGRRHQGLQARILHRSLGPVLSGWHNGTTQRIRRFQRFSNRHTRIRCANLESAETQANRHLCRCAGWKWGFWGESCFRARR